MTAMLLTSMATGFRPRADHPPLARPTCRGDGSNAKAAQYFKELPTILHERREKFCFRETKMQIGEFFIIAKGRHGFYGLTRIREALAPKDKRGLKVSPRF
jgi:hypothetical protein